MEYNIIIHSFSLEPSQLRDKRTTTTTTTTMSRGYVRQSKLLSALTLPPTFRRHFGSWATNRKLVIAQYRIDVWERARMRVLRLLLASPAPPSPLRPQFQHNVVTSYDVAKFSRLQSQWANEIATNSSSLRFVQKLVMRWMGFGCSLSVGPSRRRTSNRNYVDDPIVLTILGLLQPESH